MVKPHPCMYLGAVVLPLLAAVPVALGMLGLQVHKDPCCEVLK